MAIAPRHFDGVSDSIDVPVECSGSNRRSVRINFTLNPVERLQEGTRRLATAAHATLQA